MALTGPQLSTLKTDIAGNTGTIPSGQPWTGAFAGTQVKDVPNTSDGNAAVAGWYGLEASPDFWVWRTRVGKGEFVQKTSADADGTSPRDFIWAGNGFITRSAGEQAAWDQLFNGEGEANPSLANVRTAITDIFSGTGNAASNRTHLSNIAKRKASRAEKLFATGTGTHASPGTMAVEGPLTAQDVESARNLA